MFNKNDKVTVKEGSKLFGGYNGVVLESNDTQSKVMLNISEDVENPKRVINIFENADLDIQQLENQLNEKVEDDVEFTNDFTEEEYISKANAYAEEIAQMDEVQAQDLYYRDYAFDKHPAEDDGDKIIQRALKKRLGIKEELAKNELRLTNEELVKWMDDNDAMYWTQDIEENGNVTIKGIHEDLGTYNFNTKILTLNESCEEPVIENEMPEEVDFLTDYLINVDIEDDSIEIPDWEFANIIATAEDMDESCVIALAYKFGYKVFCIQAEKFEKFVVAAKAITKENIYNDYAGYLHGNPKVFEIDSNGNIKN